MTPEYIKFKAKLKRKAKVLAKHEFQYAALKKECPHEEIEAKESYSPGGYLNCGSSSYWNQCTLCGKRSEVTTESDGMHG